MADFSSFFEIRGDQFIVKAPFMTVILPEVYFDQVLGGTVKGNIAELIGNKVNVLGIFYFRIYDKIPIDDDSKNNKSNYKTYFYKLPQNVVLCPSAISKSKDDAGEPLVVLEFGREDVFIDNLNILKDWRAVDRYFEMLLKGTIPRSLSYEDLPILLSNCEDMNGLDLNVAANIEEVMFAELSRDPNDIKKPFRMAIKENPTINMKSKKNINVTDLGKLTNTFAGLTGPNYKSGITAGITRQRTGEENVISPIELAIKDFS
jgi:hypothetical protein